MREGRKKVANIEVIPVNKNDTVQGLIEKMRETSASQVVLFSDTRLPFLRNEINLRLLKFYSEEEGKILTLVVKDRAVKKLARSLGMRIDDSLGQRGRPVPKPAGGMPATHRPTTGMETPEMPPAAGTPPTGIPTTGTPGAGVPPATGMPPVTGTPATGMPATERPATGMPPVTGTPATGMPDAERPATGMPPVTGTPATGMPDAERPATGMPPVTGRAATGRSIPGYEPFSAGFDGPVRGAASAEESLPPPRPSYSSSPGGRLAVALLVTFFTLLAGLWFLLTPRLTLVVHPVVKEWTFSIRGEIGAGFSERDLLNNQLPLRVLERRGEVVYSRTTSGKKGVGFLPARGPVVFINSSPNPVLVPKGVVVATEAGQRYATTANLMVPGKTTRYEVGVATGEEYGRAEVEVEALEKGTVGNVEAKTIIRIEGPLAKTLQVINFQRFTSGEDRWVAVVDEKDLLRAREEAERQMKFQVEEDLREMRKEENYLLLPDLVFTEVERIDADPPVGGEGEALNLRLNYRLRAGVLSTSSLYKWLRRYLQQAIPPGFVQHGEGITIRDLQVHGRDLRHSELYVQAAVKIRGRIDRRQLFQAIAGKTLDEAQFELAGFPEISQVKFRNASRVQRVPTRSFQVRFLVPLEK
jgi:hypothetical protein